MHIRASHILSSYTLHSVMIFIPVLLHQKVKRWEHLFLSFSLGYTFIDYVKFHRCKRCRSVVISGVFCGWGSISRARSPCDVPENRRNGCNSVEWICYQYGLIISGKYAEKILQVVHHSFGFGFVLCQLGGCWFAREMGSCGFRIWVASLRSSLRYGEEEDAWGAGCLGGREIIAIPKDVPSGKLTYSHTVMENHHFSWVNQLFLWSFSIAMLSYQRVAVSHSHLGFSISA